MRRGAKLRRWKKALMKAVSPWSQDALEGAGMEVWEITSARMFLVEQDAKAFVVASWGSDQKFRCLDHPAGLRPNSTDCAHVAEVKARLGRQSPV